MFISITAEMPSQTAVLVIDAAIVDFVQTLHCADEPKVLYPFFFGGPWNTCTRANPLQEPHI